MLVMGAASMIGCLLDALPLGFGFLILGRGLQGFGATTMAVCFGIIRDELPTLRRTSAYAFVASMWGVGGAAGFPLGGLVTNELSFRWIFWLALALSSTAFVLVWCFVPVSPIRSPARVDWVGLLLFAPGLTALLLAVSQGRSWGWTGDAIVGLFTAGAALIAVWVWHERRTRSPMTDLRLLSRRSVWTLNANALFAHSGLFGFFLLVPTLAQAPASTGYGLGASVARASVYLMPMSLAALAGAAGSAALVRRIGGKWATVAGTLVGIGGYALLAVGHHSREALVAASACDGAAIGITVAASATLFGLTVPQAQIGEANGMAAMFRNVGAAIGGTVMAAILAASLIPGTIYPTGHACTLVFLTAIGIISLGAVAAFLIPDVRQADADARAGAAIPATVAETPSSLSI
jgi:MFS family permease